MTTSPMFIIFFISMIFGYVNAQVGMPVQSPSEMPGMAPGPAGGGTDCMTALLGMSDCLGYVTAGSNATKPDPACCPELSGLLKNEPICLCLLLNNTAASYGIDIDLTKALQLPSACKLNTPDLSQCPASSSAPSSSEAPSYSPGGAVPGSGVAAGPGVAAIPGSANNENGAPSTVVFGLALCFALVVSFSTTSL